jgi:hypothetical protein
MPAAPAEALRGLLRGRVERPLVVPLASAVAGELQGLAPEAFLADAGKLSLLIRQVTAALDADAAVAEFGSFWDAEALGMSLVWRNGFPPSPQGRPTGADPDLSRPRAAVVLDAVARLKTLLDGAVLAAGLAGPAWLSRLCGGDPSPETIARLQLPAARALCEAGAQLVFVVESADPPTDPSAYATALGPLLGSIRFFNALPVLHLPGAADGWEPVVAGGGPYVACFDPDASPALAALAERDGGPLFGVAVPPAGAGPAARRLAALERCALVTNDGELAGRVASRDLAAAAASLRELVA